jgi:hypothetical protein
MSHPRIILLAGDATVGFSPADWEELQRLQGKLGRIRFGPRMQRPEPIRLSFLPPQKPKVERRKSRDDDPGYERFQLRLW